MAVHPAFFLRKMSLRHHLGAACWKALKGISEALLARIGTVSCLWSLSATSEALPAILQRSSQFPLLL